MYDCMFTSHDTLYNILITCDTRTKYIQMKNALFIDLFEFIILYIHLDLNQFIKLYKSKHKYIQYG